MVDDVQGDYADVQTITHVLAASFSRSLMVNISSDSPEILLGCPML
jgi:hypothetical protein